MSKTHIWVIVGAVVVVLIGIGASLFYTSDDRRMGTTNDDLGVTGSSTVTIDDKKDDGSTILTPSSRFATSTASTTLDIPSVDFAFVSPGVGQSYTTGESIVLEIKLTDPKQQLLSMGFELYNAQTKELFPAHNLPSIQSDGGASLTPAVAWSIPKTLPAGSYYILGYVNRGPKAVQSPTFEIMKNPIEITFSANNQYGTVPVREAGESVSVLWKTKGAESCSVGITSDITKDLAPNGKRTIFVRPGETLLVSCVGGTSSASERIKVVKK